MPPRQRQEAIVRTLRRANICTIDMLADIVGASRRTVLRDIAALRDEGFTIHSEPGPGGGLQLDPQSVLTTPRLSVSEVFALLINVAAVRAVGGLPFTETADRGLAKIERALPQEMAQDLRQLLACLYVGKLAPQIETKNLDAIDPALLAEFEYCFLNQKQITFSYRDAHGKKSNRTVEPQAILVLPPLLYLVAWDPDREDFRHFRMDRIRTPARVEGRSFRRRHIEFDDGIRPARIG